jgi:peptide/nickel transport system ATP-binding protein
LRVEQLTRSYEMPRDVLWRKPRLIHALRGVSLSLSQGQSLGVVGESGSGKSTLARLVMALETPSSGSVHLLGQNLGTLPVTELRRARRDFQMVFQDPYGSLDPRQTVARIVCEPLLAVAVATVTPAEQREQAGQALAAVGLRSNDLGKYPHEFSGGQRQRIAIARALITRPRLIVADEPVSALDVSVQAQVLNLMQDLQDQFGISYLLISHDLAVVDHVCDEVAVIFQGRIVEQAPAATLFRDAAHPYTQALLDAIPRLDRPVTPRARRTSLPPPPTAHAMTGCPYAPRCPHANRACHDSLPALRPVGAGHLAACHLPFAVTTPAWPALR